MKKLSKVLCLAMVASFAATATACGGGGTSSADPNDTRREVVFEYLDAGFGDEPYVAVADAYMAQNPDVKITLYPNRGLRGGALGNQLATDNVAVSDIYAYQGATDVKGWAAKGYIADLTDLCNQQTLDGRTMKASMTGNAAESMTLDGKIYAIPEYTNVVGIVYNQDLFEQYNWEIPTTTKELEALCNKIISDTNGKVTPFTWCDDADGYLYFATENWIAQYAGIADLDKFYEYSSKEIYALEDNADGSLYTAKKNALNNLVKFFLPENDWTNAKSRETDFMDAQYGVIKGDYAMMLNGAWFENEMVLELSTEQYKDRKLGMFAIPEISDASGAAMHSASYTTEGGKRVLSASYEAYYFIPEKAANKDDAKDFLLYLSSKEACEIYTEHANVVRPFDYDYGVNSEVYGKVSNFGKSVLKIADENYLYSATSNHALDWAGVAGMWPMGNRVERQMLGKDAVTNPDTYLTADYNYAKNNWDLWQQLIG